MGKTYWVNVVHLWQASLEDAPVWEKYAVLGIGGVRFHKEARNRVKEKLLLFFREEGKMNNTLG